MAEIKCALCGGPVDVSQNGKGARRWKCKKAGGNPACNGWGYAGHAKKETGAASGKVPVSKMPNEAGSGENPKPKPAPKGKTNKTPKGCRRKAKT